MAFWVFFESKLKYWRGVSGICGREGARALEFDHWELLETSKIRWDDEAFRCSPS